MQAVQVVVVRALAWYYTAESGKRMGTAPDAVYIGRAQLYLVHENVPRNPGNKKASASILPENQQGREVLVVPPMFQPRSADCAAYEGCSLYAGNGSPVCHTCRAALRHKLGGGFCIIQPVRRLSAGDRCSLRPRKMLLVLVSAFYLIG